MEDAAPTIRPEVDHPKAGNERGGEEGGTDRSEAREKLNEGRETAPPPKESIELDDDDDVEKTGTLLDGTPNALAPTGGTGIALAPPPPPPPNGTAPPNGDGETPPTLLLLLLLVFPH